MTPGPSASVVGPLRHHEFRLVWSGGVITYVGVWMQIFGQGWLVVQLAAADGRPDLAALYLGLVGLAGAVPGILVGIIGGVVADSMDRLRLILYSQIAGGVLSALLAVLTLSGLISIAGLVVLAALQATANAFDGPTRNAMLSRVIPHEHLLGAIGLQAAGWQGSTVIGPLIGGLLIGPFGVGGLFVIKALSHLTTIAAVLRMRPLEREARPAGQSALDAVREGIAFLLEERVLRWVLVFVALVSFAVRPYLQLLPAIAQRSLHVSAVELSWLLAAAGVGSFSGALLTAPVGNIRRRGVAYLSCFVAAGSLLALFAAQTVLTLALVCATLLAFSTQLTQGLTNAFLQLRTPDRLRGRVLSVNNVAYNGLIPLGTMTLGAAGTAVGLDRALATSGLLVAAIAVVVLLTVPLLRRLDAEELARAAALSARA